MESVNTVNLARRSIALTPDQMDLFVAEFFGTVVQVAGGDDSDYVIEFKAAGDMAAFKLAVQCFRV
jgi:hypothetical protein